MKNIVRMFSLMMLVEVSWAQFPTVVINDQSPNQVQPVVAASPSFDWFLGSAWNTLTFDNHQNPIFRVGWALSQDNGLDWLDGGYLDPSWLHMWSWNPSVGLDRTGRFGTSFHCVFSQVRDDYYYGAIYHLLREDFINWGSLHRISNGTFGQMDPRVAIDSSLGGSFAGRVYAVWSE